MQRAFQNSHPAVNFLFFISVLLYGMFFSHPVLLSIAFLASLCYSLSLCGRSSAKLLVRFLLPTLVFVTLINTLFAHYGVTVLATLPNGNAITLEALTGGFVGGLRVVTVCLWFSCYNAVITTDKFLCLFGKRLPTLAMLVSLTLRFLPLSARRLRKIHEAQKGIGNSGKSKLQNAVHELSILISWSLENAVDVADSMKGRGYGLRGRTTYSRYCKTKRDIVLFCIILLLDIFMLSGIVLRQVDFSYNPMIVLPPVSAFRLALFIGYGALCFLPPALDFSEELIWNKSK